MYNLPDENGFYGKFGGQFVPETLMYAVKELDEVYKASQKDEKFQEEFNEYLREYVGRPNPLYFALSSDKCTA